MPSSLLTASRAALRLIASSRGRFVRNGSLLHGRPEERGAGASGPAPRVTRAGTIGGRLLSCLALLLIAASPLAPAVAAPCCEPVQEADRWIVVFPAADEAALREQGVEIWDRDAGVVLASAGQAALEALADKQVQPTLRVADHGEWIYLLSHDEGFAPPVLRQAEAFVISSTASLYLIPTGQSFDLPHVRPYAAFRGVPRLALPPVAVHEADKALPLTGESTLTVNPLVTQIVNATSQSNWFQYVKDLSGENTVVIGGVTRTISTRYSYSMYPTPTTNALATEYLLEKAAGWGYTGVRETYTSTDSGCGAQSPNVWQNLVFTLPGQVDLGHQQVIFVTHHDSLSFSDAESRNYAPGADDAISGGSALIEALRLFKDYGFRNTVKIIFFSGEEQGLCGSIAYTRQPQHPVADMWRVVNMDQTAYDGNLNAVMDCYNWDAANSPGSVALGDAFVQANLDYGPIITPANIFRPTNKMCQTDHCPFWNVGVAAIAVTEDLAHSDLCPCFDQSQTPTCHDTVTQIDPTHPGQIMFDQNYSWRSEKNAIATVAALAQPLYACPGAAPTLNAAPGNHSVGLSWSSAAGVTDYALERGASCAGPFTPIATSQTLGYNDSGLTNGTSYAYRLRTCPNQVSACVTATPNGPSIVYQTGSATVTADSGDHDLTPDNCELVTVQVSMTNDGNAPLTGVKLSNVTSTFPGVQVASAIPQVEGSLGIGATTQGTFKFYLGRNGTSAACGQSIPFSVTVGSDQSPSSTQNFSFLAENDLTPGPQTYTFESGFDGWTVTAGSFTRVAGGAPGSTAFSMHSRNINNICDAIASPTIVPTGTSSMTMWVNFSIEGNGSTSNVWDRAVVRAINTLTGAKTLLIPTGAPYTTTGHGTGLILCDNIDLLQGYAGTNAPNPTWRQATFNLASFAGIPIQIEVRFGTDSNTLGTQGFWFDQVQITNASQVACDAQGNACAALPAEVSPNATPVQFTITPVGANYALRFSEVAGATKYNLYGGTLTSLHAGIYDHASSGGICSLIDGSPGDGQVQLSRPASNIPSGSYLLVAAQNAAGESIYGLTSTGATIPLAVANCP